MFTKIRFDEFEQEIVFEIGGKAVARVSAKWMNYRSARSAFIVLQAIDAVSMGIVGEYPIVSFTVSVKKSSVVIGNIDCTDDKDRVCDVLRLYYYRLTPSLPSSANTCAMARGSSDTLIIESYDTLGASSGCAMVDAKEVDAMIASAKAATGTWSYGAGQSIPYASNVRSGSLPSMIELLERARDILTPKPPAPIAITATIDTNGELKIKAGAATVVHVTLVFGTIRALHSYFKSGSTGDSSYTLDCCGQVEILRNPIGDLTITPVKSSCHGAYTFHVNHLDAIKSAIAKCYE